MMFKLTCPNARQSERKYIASVMLLEFLGLDYSLTFDSGITTRLSYSGKTLEMADVLLQTPDTIWLTKKSLPVGPLQEWDLSQLPLEIHILESRLPVIYGNPPFYSYSGNNLKLGLDILGSAFFMLTRYEEVVIHTRDNHSRFPSTCSLAATSGFLHRPIINEYLEILRAAIKALWPETRFKSRTSRIFATHDVDQPFNYAHLSLWRMIRMAMGSLLKHKQPIKALRTATNWCHIRAGGRDPFDTFDHIMDATESRGQKSAFYFITDRTDAKDGNYDINHPRVRALLRRIAERGHEIGLHLSYNSYLDPQQSKREFDILRHACEAEGIQQSEWGGRQHFLRWQTPDTFRNWDDAGLHYDSTLSFADQAGFRCGTCYEYPTFDLHKQQALKLRERPLALMECSVIDPRYMGLGNGNAAREAILRYKRNCLFFNGDFTFLWHNTRLLEHAENELFLYALDAK